MIGRCYNPDDKSYRWYGGKGIHVCDEWLNDPSEFQRWAFETAMMMFLPLIAENQTKIIVRKIAIGSAEKITPSSSPRRQ